MKQILGAISEAKRIPYAGPGADMRIMRDRLYPWMARYPQWVSSSLLSRQDKPAAGGQAMSTRARHHNISDLILVLGKRLSGDIKGKSTTDFW